MAISNDFTIDYANKIIKHSSGTTVYSVNQLYSYLMNVFDDLNQMDDTVPMTAQTPTAYTMVNGWFLDIGSVSNTHKFLDGGAIQTSGYINVIHTLNYDTISTSPDVNDIGEDVLDDGAAVGPLLAYDTTNLKLWVREARDAFAAIADGSQVTGGEGLDVDANGGSITGEELYANIYSLGTIESAPAPQIYVFQDGVSIIEWSDYTNWDRGHLDVLIQVKEAGININGALVTVYARQYGDLYDHYEIDLSNGGRNAVPIATSSDLNNTTPEYYLMVSGSTGTFTAGEIIKDTVSNATAEVINWTDLAGASNCGVLGLCDVKGIFGDTNLISGQTSAAIGSGQGTIGDSWFKYDNVTHDPVLNELVKGEVSTAWRIVKGVDKSNNACVVAISSNASGSVKTAYCKEFTDNECVSGSTQFYASANVTTVDTDYGYGVAGFYDVTVSFVNGTATYENKSTTVFTESEKVQWSSTGSAILLYDDGTSTVTLGNVTSPNFSGKTFRGDLSAASGAFTSHLIPNHTMSQNFEQQSSYPYDVIVECGSIYNTGRTLSDVYETLKYITGEESMYKTYPLSSAAHSGIASTPISGESYILAWPSYSPVKSAPFGTFAGGVLFGAQGVWVEGMATADNQNYQLIDSNGTTTPPVSINIVVTATISGDRVSVFRVSTNSTTTIDKWMYKASGTVNLNGNPHFWVSGNLAVDTPANGYLRLVSGTTEQRLTYDSWVSSCCLLFSSNATLNTNYLENGMYAYIPFIDQTVTTTSITQSVVYTADRLVLARVRKYGGAGSSIIPFESPGTVTSTGYSVAAIRTSDSIVT